MLKEELEKILYKTENNLGNIDMYDFEVKLEQILALFKNYTKAKMPEKYSEPNADEYEGFNRGVEATT